MYSVALGYIEVWWSTWKSSSLKHSRRNLNHELRRIILDCRKQSSLDLAQVLFPTKQPHPNSYVWHPSLTLLQIFLLFFRSHELWKSEINTLIEKMVKSVEMDYIFDLINPRMHVYLIPNRFWSLIHRQR